MDCEARCRSEVGELHDFFAAWFRGDLPGTDDAFDRFAGVMAPSFRIVSPAGVALDREHLLEAVRRRHGSDPDFTIEVRDHRHRFTIGEISLVTYEEWQTSGDEARGRLSSAILRQRPGTPHGLEWLHVHETWKGETLKG